MPPDGFLQSRRSVLRGLASAASALAVGGCAGMAETGGARFDESAMSKNPEVIVATTRKATAGARVRPWYSGDRSSTMSYARIRLVPPDGGRFSLTSMGVADWRIGAVETADQLPEPAPGGDRNALLYVHGFNTTFETAVLDAARLSDGIHFPGETMAFSWPSKGKLLDYGYDRESAMWSRDALEQMLDQLDSSSSISRVHIIAHSVGTMVTMEALRQFHARRGSAASDRIGAVVFASPDIDMDVFTSSIERVGDLSSKITVITATNDRALAISRWMAGGITRVGAAEKVQLEKLGLRVIDASQRGWGIVNHDLFMSNAQIRRLIRAAIDGNPDAAVPAVQAAVPPV